ncbi:cell division protein FtsN [Pseudacidovorax intermedius]|uniref:Cell division protein FtsN n=1 Tax=Pseudacidovorax intermedius TaxID=433924 RepID=A0A370FLK8_9BURK|nr:SPOR domain-containing protein [Pseudacidovorax intermedius]RDI28576.1 cell division protein FtsN [Pseudacidovorax intermedius]
MRSRQQGNFAIGLIVGLVLGLGVALGVAVYVTKVPIPFMTKTQPRATDQDEAEARKNRDWDPNSPLYGKQQPKPPAAPGAPAGGIAPPVTNAPPVPAIAAQPGTPPSTATPPTAVTPAMPRTPATAAKPPASADPLGDLARARAGLPASGGDAGSDPFVYFVQAGAFRTSDDAESQRAKLSLMGVEVRVTEREQAGRPVFRVRAGPYSKKDDADRLKERLDGAGFDAALVRVQR